MILTFIRRRLSISKSIGLFSEFFFFFFYYHCEESLTDLLDDPRSGQSVQSLLFKEYTTDTRFILNQCANKNQPKLQ